HRRIHVRVFLRLPAQAFGDELVAQIAPRDGFPGLDLRQHVLRAAAREPPRAQRKPFGGALIDGVDGHGVTARALVFNASISALPCSVMYFRNSTFDALKAFSKAA